MTRILAGLTCLLAVLVLQGCGRSATAPEKVCGWRITHGAILNAQGDTITVWTFKQYSCT